MKRVCVLAIILAICSGLLAPTVGAGFDDISDQVTQAAATLLQNLGIVAGYEDGKFHPADNLTRAQFCKMAVMLSGTRDVAAYEGFTVFPDVRANHWGQGYINAAVRLVKIITGFPDGTFKPDIPISFAQAVTTLMRLLGYTDSDVGMSWPRGYLDKAAQIGLTKGIGADADDSITRAQAAQMFSNAIFATGRDGNKYCEMLGFTEEKVIILHKEGTGPDGSSKGLVTIGGLGFYRYRSAIDVEAGARGTLLVDGDGYILNWAPDLQSKKEVIVKETGPMSVTGTDGSKINNIPATAEVYINGELDFWSSCWIDIPPGLALRFFFGASGAIDYIFLYQPTDEGVVRIITSEPAKGTNPLPSLGMDVGARVIKNGVMSTWADLRLLDVLVYDAAAGVVNATDFRITGVYENALPSREAPDYVITLGGKIFELLPNVRPKLAERKLGDSMTFFFTSDGRVADIRTDERAVYQPGITTGDGAVVLYNGMIISGEMPQNGNYGGGSPVNACMRESGKLSLTSIAAKDSVDLNIKEMKAGAADIAPYAVFFDVCATGGRAERVDISSLPDIINAGSVIAVSSDNSGRANLIVLKNVTGDAWFYGFTTIELGMSEFLDEDGYPIYDNMSNKAIVHNQYGARDFSDPRSYAKNSGSSIYGLAVSTNGSVLVSRSCTRVNNIKRSDFSGNTALTVSGELRPIPDGLMVYVQATKAYITIAEARLYSNNFTVYLDKPASEGGKPRFIIAL